MTFSDATTPTAVPRVARRLALAWVLFCPLVSPATLETPQRPATVLASRMSPTIAVRRESRAHPREDPQTYLAMIGPAPLSFAPAEPALPPEPALPTPPKPKPLLPPEANAKTPGQASANGKDSSGPNSASLGLPPESSSDNGEKPVPILPDDTPRNIRPEDVLPYFEFPGASDGGSASIPLTLPAQPAPGTPPPSSATYRQQ